MKTFHVTQAGGFIHVGWRAWGSAEIHWPKRAAVQEHLRPIRGKAGAYLQRCQVHQALESLEESLDQLAGLMKVARKPSLKVLSKKMILQDSQVVQLIVPIIFYT